MKCYHSLNKTIRRGAELMGSLARTTMLAAGTIGLLGAARAASAQTPAQTAPAAQAQKPAEAPDRPVLAPPPPPGTVIPPDARSGLGQQVGGHLVQVREIQRAEQLAKDNVTDVILRSRVVEWQDELDAAVAGGDKSRVINAVRGLRLSYEFFLGHYAALQGPIDDVRKKIHAANRSVNGFVANHSAASAIDRKKQLELIDRRLEEDAVRIDQIERAGGNADVERARFQQNIELREVTAIIARERLGRMGLEESALGFRSMLQQGDDALVYFEHVLNLAQTSLQGEVELLVMGEAAIQLAIDLEALKQQGVLDTKDLRDWVGSLVKGRGALQQALRDITTQGYVAPVKTRPEVDQQIQIHLRRAESRRNAASATAADVAPQQ